MGIHCQFCYEIISELFNLFKYVIWIKWTLYSTLCCETLWYNFRMLKVTKIIVYLNGDWWVLLDISWYATKLFFPWHPAFHISWKFTNQKVFQYSTQISVNLCHAERNCRLFSAVLYLPGCVRLVTKSILLFISILLLISNLHFVIWVFLPVFIGNGCL